MSRIDEWTHEQDAILAETVITYVRTGRTQLEAFATAGESLNRTSGACGFRWNSVVRNNYKKHLMEARKEGEKVRLSRRLPYAGAYRNANQFNPTLTDVSSNYPSTISESKTIIVSSDAVLWVKYVKQGSSTFIEILSSSPLPEDVLAGGYAILGSKDLVIKI